MYIEEINFPNEIIEAIRKNNLKIISREKSSCRMNLSSAGIGGGDRSVCNLVFERSD